MAAPVVLMSKLHPPVARAQMISRPRLVDHLRVCIASRPVTVVSACAGSGKTTLLAQVWDMGDLGRPAAWVSLDGSDNDPARFWAHVIAALRGVGVTLSPRVDDLGRPGPASTRLDQDVPAFVNELDPHGRIILMLDDFHVITGEQVLTEIDVLLAHPLGLRLVLAGRTDPHLSLPRLRAAQAMGEIRDAELAFTPAETASLVRDVHNLRLGADDIETIHARSEGWTTGVQLALMSLVGRDHEKGLLNRREASRWVIDYLWDEVLRRQPEHVQGFLVRTSILDSLSASLCDAVTGRHDSALILDRLAQENAFVISLDNRRCWYRYHHLFAEALESRMVRIAPDEVDELHRRASHWHDAAGDLTQAVRHAIGAGDMDLLTHALDARPDRHPFFDGRLFSESHLPLMSDWIRRLRPGPASQDPRLCLLAAWVALSIGDPRRARFWLHSAEAVVRDRGSEGFAGEAEVQLAWLVHHQLVGDLASADAAGEAVLTTVSATSPLAAMAQVGLAANRHWLGDLAEASLVLGEAVGRLERGSNDLTMVLALGHLAELNRRAGRLASAEHIAARAIGIADRAGLAHHHCAALAWASAGAVLAQRARFGDAKFHLSRALRAARQSAEPATVAHVLVRLAELHQQLGGDDTSLALLHAARGEANHCLDVGTRQAILAWVDAEVSRSEQPLDEALRSAETLTHREIAVLRMLSGTLTQPEIASELGVSLNTVKSHVKAIYLKLYVTSRTDAVERARDLGYLPSPAPLLWQ